MCEKYRQSSKSIVKIQRDGSVERNLLRDDRRIPICGPFVLQSGGTARFKTLVKGARDTFLRLPYRQTDLFVVANVRVYYSYNDGYFS